MRQFAYLPFPILEVSILPQELAIRRKKSQGLYRSLNLIMSKRYFLDHFAIFDPIAWSKELKGHIRVTF